MAVIDAYCRELAGLRVKYGYTCRDFTWYAGARVPPVVRARMRKLINYINRARYGSRHVSKVWAWLDSPSLERLHWRCGRTGGAYIPYRTHYSDPVQDRGDYVA